VVVPEHLHVEIYIVLLQIVSQVSVYGREVFQAPLLELVSSAHLGWNPWIRRMVCRELEHPGVLVSAKGPGTNALQILREACS